MHSSPAASPGDTHSPLRGSRFPFTGAIPHHHGVLASGERVLFISLLSRIEVFSWDLFRANKFPTNTFVKLLSGRIQTDLKMVSFLKNEAAF